MAALLLILLFAIRRRAWLARVTCRLETSAFLLGRASSLFILSRRPPKVVAESVARPQRPLACHAFILVIS